MSAREEIMYGKALEFATEKHIGQQRIGGSSYIDHPVAVAQLVRESGYGLDYQIAALFHDLLEDTDATKSEIAALSNDVVLEAVVLLTKQKGYNMQEYIGNICENPMAKAVKAADRLHNLQSALVTSEDFKRRYILETLDWYMDFSSKIPKAVKVLAQTLTQPMTELSLLYEPVKNRIISCSNNDKNQSLKLREKRKDKSKPLQFKSITVKDGARLHSYYKNCNYGLCEYSVGTKLMWGRTLNTFWAEAGGCLIIRNKIDNELVFDYPVPGPHGDMEEALVAVEVWCIDHGVPLIFSIVPEEMAKKLLSRYTYLQSSSVRTWRDYVYAAKDLRSFSGRRYSGQRNHVKKFRASCSSAEFYILTMEDKALVDAFWADYDQAFTKVTKTAICELRYAKRMLNQMGRSWFRVGGMLWNGRLLSICLTEKCGDTLIIHIEKALYRYDGIYPATVQCVAKAFSQDVQWINREDDAANIGLRTSKLQYQPSHIIPKYRLRVQNDLEVRVPNIPTLITERLTLDAFTDVDTEDYYELCTNAERNCWWGYDDVGSMENKLTCHETFLRVAQEDFKNRRAINFAVRLEGRLIGEVTLYRFDYRGSAELGCRISNEYAGHGYGTEAFAEVANWALYHVYMHRVVAKCFKKNVASYKMLASCMRKNGEDDTYFYFQKLV